MIKKGFFTSFTLSLLLSAPGALAKNHDILFENWKRSFEIRHASKKLPAHFIRKSLKDLKYDPVVIKRDRNQITSNTKIDYEKWIQKWLGEDKQRVKTGKKKLQKYDRILSEVEKKYKVDKEILVALWGVETKYGKITGSYNVIRSLATLSYDKRRRKFFERELVAALKIVKRGDRTVENFLGSWAGATGQCQFMPSNILQYGRDHDGDGKVDIWNNKEDLFASMAYFLKRLKWKKGKSVGTLAVKTETRKFNYNKSRTPSSYNKLGVRTIEGEKLDGNWRRKVAKVPFKNSPIILRGSNYKTLLKWNNSSLFAALNIKLVTYFNNSSSK